MIKLDIHKIIDCMRTYMRDMYRWSNLKEQYKEVILNAPWQPDGTGRGLQCCFKGEHWYIILDKPALAYFNKVHWYSMVQQCHLRKQSKHNEDIMEFRIDFMNLPLVEE